MQWTFSKGIWLGGVVGFAAWTEEHVVSTSPGAWAHQFAHRVGVGAWLFVVICMLVDYLLGGDSP